MICAAAVLHNLLLDVGDGEVFEAPQDDQDSNQTSDAMQAFNLNVDRTKAEMEFSIMKRNSYMERFYEHDNS